MTESAYPATVLVTRRLLADVLFGLAERAFPKLESRDPGGTRRLVESMIADVAIEGTPAPAETPDSTTQNPCGFRIAMGEVHVCAFPKGHSGDLHRADYEASSVWFRSDPRFWFAANSPADLGVCHRCGNEIPHFAPLTGDTLATSGFYYVRGGAWERFARGNGELYVCDACMWADPQYIAEYGRAPTGIAADPDARERLIALLESCAVDREQEGHDAADHTPEAVEPFMNDARRLRAHAAELRRASPSIAATPDATETVAEQIVSFLEDMLTSDTRVTFMTTVEHDGVRLHRNDNDVTIWINAPIGDPDERGYVKGETFTEAMTDVIRIEAKRKPNNE